MIESRWFAPAGEGHSHRKALETQAVLAGWAAARGREIPIEILPVALCDEIVLAAVRAVCERVLLWDGQNRPPAPEGGTPEERNLRAWVAPHEHDDSYRRPPFNSPLAAMVWAAGEIDRLRTEGRDERIATLEDELAEATAPVQPDFPGMG